MTDNKDTPSSVLIVDDSPGICQTMSMILRRMGFSVDYALDGPAAVEQIKQKPFDFVLLDIRLPGMDGVEVNKQIRSIRPKSRVAMMTAYAIEGKVQEALKNGAETVFYKPLDIDNILKFLKTGHGR